MRVLGAVLGGGESRRFGSDKALALLHGKPLIAHVVAALGAQTDGLVICGRAWDDLPMVTDRPAPGLGPLGGIAGALHYAAAQGYDAVMSVGCDMPLLSADLVMRLCAAGDAAFVRDYPVIGLWPASAAARIDAHLATTQDRSMRGWARSMGAIPVHLPPMANINRPEDLVALERENPL